MAQSPPSASTVKCFVRALMGQVKGLDDAGAAKIVGLILDNKHYEATEAVRMAMQPGTTVGNVLQKFQYARNAGLLSGPPTSLTKLLSDNIMQIVRLGERSIVSPTEGAYATRAYVANLWPALKTMGHELASDPGFDIEHPEGLTHQINPFGQSGWAQAIGAPYKLISAIDKGMGLVGSRVNLAQLSAREGMRRGLRGDALDKFVDAVASAPESVPGLLESVAAAAKRDRFQQDLPVGGIAQSLANLSRTNPIANFIFPFVKTPYNIAREAFIRTPLGFASLAYKAHKEGWDHQQMLDEFVKPVLGTALMTGFATLAANGTITGGGPSDHREYSDKIQTGWQPYSFHVGDAYYSYHRAEPIASLLGASADFMEGLKSAPKAKQGELVQKALQSIQENLTGKTYMTGMENLFGAIHDPKGMFPAWLKSMEGSLVPAIVGRAAQVADPTIRETHASDLSPIEARIPGLSQRLPAAVSALGQEEHREPDISTRLENAVSPLTVSHDRPDAVVEKELDRLGIAPPAPNKVFTLGNLKSRYTDDEYRAINTRAGSIERPQMQALIQSEGYANLPDEYKEKLLKDISSHAHTAARMSIRGDVITRLQKEQSGGGNGGGGATRPEPGARSPQP
jgi:hypothetical protein